MTNRELRENGTDRGIPRPVRDMKAREDIGIQLPFLESNSLSEEETEIAVGEFNKGIESSGVREPNRSQSWASRVEYRSTRIAPIRADPRCIRVAQLGGRFPTHQSIVQGRASG